MYRSCIHCNSRLGANEMLEHFPVGRRLAYDASRGRLWVICTACDRWNLSPLEERWEGIEDAERRFRASRLRMSTDQIGMARLRDGTDLIRIGAPLRPELAAWRYADRFGRRRRRNLLVAGAGMTVVGVGYGALVAGGGLGVAAHAFAVTQLMQNIAKGRPDTRVASLQLPTGEIVHALRQTAMMSVLEDDTTHGLSLRFESEHATHQLTGHDAMRAASKLLPVINRYAGSRQTLAQSVRLLEDAGDAEHALTTLQRQFGWKPGQPTWNVGGGGVKVGWANRNDPPPPPEKPIHVGWAGVTSHPPTQVRGTLIEPIPGALHTLPPAARLALEMAVHEESERRAMEGELAELETAWREAEEIAAIADSLTVPSVVSRSLQRLRSLV